MAGDIYVLNAQSILAHHSDILCLVHIEKPVLVCVTETHLTQDIDSNEVKIDGYYIIRVDSVSRHTGGVMCYIKKGIKCVIMDTYTLHKNYWIIKTKLEINEEKFVLCVVYRSPNGSRASFLQLFENVCDDLVINNKGSVTMATCSQSRWLRGPLSIVFSQWKSLYAITSQLLL